MSAEEETGPTIFEAAADEEIKDSHWCETSPRSPPPQFPPALDLERDSSNAQRTLHPLSSLPRNPRPRPRAHQRERDL